MPTDFRPVVPTALPAAEQGAVAVGTLSQDAFTPEQISLYLPVTGTVSQSAVAEVEYKRTTSDTWLDAHPLHRIDYLMTLPSNGVYLLNKPLEDAFSGVIFDLLQGTDYDIRVTVTEPGVGVVEKTAVYSTRALPGVSKDATVTVTDQTELSAALSAASPGDVIEITGEIPLAGGLNVYGNGTEAQPITLRGDDRDTAILSIASPAILLRPITASHWVLENFTLKGSGEGYNDCGIQFDNSSGAGQDAWTIRNMRITDVGRAIVNYGSSANAVSNVLVYDCIINGVTPFTEESVDNSGYWSNDGIRLGGQNIAVFNCDIDGFGDCVSFRQQTDVFDIIGCFFYRNKITNSQDDAIEAEYLRRNCAFYDNHVTNCSTSVSFDGIFGGPYFHFRNRTVNTVRTAFKCGENASGLYFYHNTIVSKGRGGYMTYGGPSFYPKNWVFQNNVQIWEGSNSIWRIDPNPTAWSPLIITYNGWGRNDQTIHWAGAPGFGGSVATVNANLTPMHDNDYEITDQAAVLETPVVFGTDGVNPPISVDYDLALVAGSEAINKAISIPNITAGT